MCNFINIHSSHYLGVNKMDINRVRSGFDKVVAHRCRYPFAQPAREDGVVVEHDEEAKLLKVKYKSGEVEAFKYGDEYVSNGGGGFYCTQTMTNNGFTVGDKVKKGDVVTFNEKFFGKDIFSKQVIWKLGRMTETILMEADGTLDDACKISRSLAFDLGFQPCHIRDISLDISTNVHMYAAVDSFVKNIDPLIIYDQSAMTDDMFGTLDAKAIQLLTKLNRKPIKAKFTGKIVKIEAFYKCQPSDMSPSLKKLVSIINKGKAELKKKVEGTINEDQFPSVTNITKSDRIGLSDIGMDNVILRFYIQQEMGMQAGSKIEFAGSLKSVCSEIVDEGWELENGDHVDAQFSAIGINNRIVLSPFLTGLTNKVMGHLEKTILDEYYS